MNERGDPASTGTPAADDPGRTGVPRAAGTPGASSEPTPPSGAPGGPGTEASGAPIELVGAPVGATSAASARREPTPAPLIQAAILTLLGGLLPVPFLDDVVVRRARRRMVEQLLRAHGSTLDGAALRPLWGEEGGCLAGCLGLGFKLILVPIRKLIRTLLFVLALRSAALQVGWTLQLGRTVERLLASGALSGAGGLPQDVQVEARRLRAAFERAYAGSDGRLLASALSSAVRGVRGLRREAVRVAAADEGGPVEDALAAPRERALGAAVRGVLEREDIRAYLAEFDRRFDDALALERSRATGPTPHLAG